MTPLLDISGLEVRYGGVRAVQALSLTIPQGQSIVLIGPNGAGKSSLLLAIAGAVTPSAGTIRLDGRTINGHPPERIVAAGVALVPETRDIFKKLSVHENLLIGGSLVSDRQAFSATLDRIYALFPRLAERRHGMGGLLSGGEQQMLAIGRALMSQPRLLMLDEPSLGLAPVITDTVFETIAGLKAAGTSVLLVEQNAERAMGLCERAYLMSAGRIDAQGTPAELEQAQSAAKAMFGAHPATGASA